MKKKAAGSKSKASRKLTAKDLNALVTEVRGLIQSARHAAATTVNTLQVLTNFEIGRHIIEHEQRGAARAAYGKELLKELSAHLTDEIVYTSNAGFTFVTFVRASLPITPPKIVATGRSRFYRQSCACALLW